MTGIACEIDRVGIPRTEPRVALHGVLSASAATQVVLLERTRSGAVPSFDLGDPLFSSTIAETDAVVELTTPSGRTFTAVEDKHVPSNKGQGSGFYRFALSGDSLERGGPYRLTVRTPSGGVLSAETAVPQGVADAVGEQRSFDRSRDTLLIQWPAAAGARSYFVRVETPFGPHAFFTDSTRIRLTGDLRNVDEQLLPRVFIPGFPQAVTVSAVDSNYYDWFRSRNNALSAMGLINRVEGGIGVFGAIVRLHFEQLVVVSPQTERAAGTFDFSGTQFDRSVTPYLGLELYVESRASRADQADALSGRYHRRPFLGLVGCITCGVLGTVRNGQITLALLRDWYASDTAEIFTGEIRGDTIVGSYRGQGGPVRFVKQP